LKKALTFVLLAFVVLSAGFLMYQEMGKKSSEPEKVAQDAGAAAQVSADKSPVKVDDVPEDSRNGNVEADNSATEDQAEVIAEGESKTADNPVVEKTETETRAPAPKVERKTIAYYFYAEPRCASCRKIEAFTDEAIRTGFEKELGTGALEWKPVDIKEKGNEHFIQDYQLYSKSVVIVNMEDGKQVGWKNLEEVWNLLNNKQGFIDYIQSETRAFMEGNS